MEMGRSILQSAAACYICGKTRDLHRHHIFYGVANRKRSEQYGCWVYLCPEHHNMSNRGVHFDIEKDIKLKKQCQLAWERRYGTRDEFVAVFGRSYL